ANALQREADALASRNDLAQANDKLRTSVARGRLGRLARHLHPNQPSPPLNDQEVESLWELASEDDERGRVRFVEGALQDPEPLRRLKDRAAFALQAAVGLHPTHRSQVVELLGERLQAREIAPEQQVQVALCLAHLGVLDRTLAGRAAATLTQAM